MIKYVCDTCGADLRVRKTLLKIFTVSELFGAETTLCSSEHDLCENCAKKIRDAAERHSWEEKQTAPREDPDEDAREVEDKTVEKAVEDTEEKDQKTEKTKRQQGERKERAIHVDHGKIIALRNAGWPVKEICAEMNLSSATVFNHLKMEKRNEEEQGM